MKIKGIDLYKKVLDKDESVLHKKFTNGKYTVKVDNTYYEEQWGLTHTNGNLLNNKSSYDIHYIFLSEWEEVKQPVTWQEAIKAWINGRGIYCEVEGDIFEYPSPKLQRNLTDSKWGRGVCISELTEGLWYIEDYSK